LDYEEAHRVVEQEDEEWYDSNGEDSDRALLYDEMVRESGGVWHHLYVFWYRSYAFYFLCRKYIENRMKGLFIGDEYAFVYDAVFCVFSVLHWQ
jgi:hypothetical protein